MRWTNAVAAVALATLIWTPGARHEWTTLSFRNGHHELLTV
jgi:hypothetical protein